MTSTRCDSSRVLSYIKQLGGLDPLPTVGPLADVGIVAVAWKLCHSLLWMDMMMLMMLMMNGLMIWRRIGLGMRMIVRVRLALGLALAGLGLGLALRLNLIGGHDC